MWWMIQRSLCSAWRISTGGVLCDKNATDALGPTSKHTALISVPKSNLIGLVFKAQRTQNMTWAWQQIFRQGPVGFKLGKSKMDSVQGLWDFRRKLWNSSLEIWKAKWRMKIKQRKRRMRTGKTNEIKNIGQLICKTIFRVDCLISLRWLSALSIIL